MQEDAGRLGRPCLSLAPGQLSKARMRRFSSADADQGTEDVTVHSESDPFLENEEPWFF